MQGYWPGILNFGSVTADKGRILMHFMHQGNTSFFAKPKSFQRCFLAQSGFPPSWCQGTSLYFHCNSCYWSQILFQCSCSSLNNYTNATLGSQSCNASSSRSSFMLSQKELKTTNQNTLNLINTPFCSRNTQQQKQGIPTVNSSHSKICSLFPAQVFLLYLLAAAAHYSNPS